MINNFLKVAFRNLVRNKAFSIINVSGLAIGMASALLILLWVKNELSYDRFYSKTGRIYKVYSRDKVNGSLQAIGQTPAALGPALKKNYPEVEDAVRFRRVTFLATVGEKHLNVQGAFADSAFLSMFDFPLLAGDMKTSLNENNDIVLTEGLAKKLFGEKDYLDAVGKTVRIDSTDNFKVTAILKILPANTQFEFEYLLPWNYIVQLGWAENNDWMRDFTDTYITLIEQASPSQFDKNIKNIIRHHAAGSGNKANAEVFTQPLSRLYLYSKSENGRLVGGRIRMIRLFAVISVFILLIACINFMNLSTARSEKRAKEVGVRKVIGALKSSLIAQFIGESILISFISFGFGLIIVWLCLPAFDRLTGKQLSIDFGNPFYLLFAIAFVLFTGFTAGCYPAFYLSSFAPARIFKGNLQKINALLTPRKLLVILQFTFAIILIICTIIVEQQVKFAQDRDAGYNKNNLIYTFTQGDVNKHFELIKHNLLKSGAAVAVTRSYSPVTRLWNEGTGFRWDGSTLRDENTDFTWFGSDADFVTTLGVQLVEGRDIDVYHFPADSTAMILNEEAVKEMGLNSAVGKTVTFVPDGRQWHVVGVVKNFILESPFEEIKPMMIVGPSQFLQVVHIKLNPANTTAVNLAKAEKIFKQYNPQYPFDYYFVDEAYAQKFNNEQRIETLAKIFAGLAVFISCLGLFGLAAYMAINRVKEIGIRKVLGATASNITFLLSADFLKLIVIAVMIASPVAYFTMHNWLSNYQYRTVIHWWIFFGAGALAILIALLTVSVQAIRAAIANPIKSLRTE